MKRKRDQLEDTPREDKGAKARKTMHVSSSPFTYEERHNLGPDQLENLYKHIAAMIEKEMESEQIDMDLLVELTKQSIEIDEIMLEKMGDDIDNENENEMRRDKEYAEQIQRQFDEEEKEYQRQREERLKADEEFARRLQEEEEGDEDDDDDEEEDNQQLQSDLEYAKQLQAKLDREGEEEEDDDDVEEEEEEEETSTTRDLNVEETPRESSVSQVQTTPTPQHTQQQPQKKSSSSSSSEEDETEEEELIQHRSKKDEEKVVIRKTSPEREQPPQEEEEDIYDDGGDEAGYLSSQDLGDTTGEEEEVEEEEEKEPIIVQQQQKVKKEESSRRERIKKRQSTPPVINLISSSSESSSEDEEEKEIILQKKKKKKHEKKTPQKRRRISIPPPPNLDSMRPVIDKEEEEEEEDIVHHHEVKKVSRIMNKEEERKGKIPQNHHHHHYQHQQQEQKKVSSTSSTTPNKELRKRRKPLPLPKSPQIGRTVTNLPIRKKKKETPQKPIVLHLHRQDPSPSKQQHQRKISIPSSSSSHQRSTSRSSIISKKKIIPPPPPPPSKKGYYRETKNPEQLFAERRKIRLRQTSSLTSNQPRNKVKSESMTSKMERLARQDLATKHKEDMKKREEEQEEQKRGRRRVVQIDHPQMLFSPPKKRGRPKKIVKKKEKKKKKKSKVKDSKSDSDSDSDVQIISVEEKKRLRKKHLRYNPYLNPDVKQPPLPPPKLEKKKIEVNNNNNNTSQQQPTQSQRKPIDSRRVPLPPLPLLPGQRQQPSQRKPIDNRRVPPPPLDPLPSLPLLPGQRQQLTSSQLERQRQMKIYQQQQQAQQGGVDRELQRKLLFMKHYPHLARQLQLQQQQKQQLQQQPNNNNNNRFIPSQVNPSFVPPHIIQQQQLRNKMIFMKQQQQKQLLQQRQRDKIVMQQQQQQEQLQHRLHPGVMMTIGQQQELRRVQQSRNDMLILRQKYEQQQRQQQMMSQKNSSSQSSLVNRNVVPNNRYLSNFNSPSSSANQSSSSNLTTREMKGSELSNSFFVDKNPYLHELETPKMMTVTLYRHQKIALHWLMDRENGRLSGGILADDMGLGKTIEMAALMLQNEKLVKRTLIVAPLALIGQWKRELLSKTRKSWDIYIYHGPGRKKSVEYLKRFDVVITTYGVVSSEVAIYDSKRERMRPKEDGPVAKVVWDRIVLDEAHLIKNRSTRSAQACYKLKSRKRWCLTGTPIQNRIDDLYSLYRFLQYRPYSEYKEFKHLVNNVRSNPRSYNAFQRARKQILLRRHKHQKLEGKPILDLPEKRVMMVEMDFDTTEQTFYDIIFKKSQVQFNRFLEEGSVMKNYAHVLTMLLRLRQCCNHPYLVQRLGNNTLKKLYHMEGDSEEEEEEEEGEDESSSEDEDYNPNKEMKSNKGEKIVIDLERDRVREKMRKKREREEQKQREKDYRARMKRFVEEHQNEKCAICEDAMVDPFCTNCSHWFCLECLHNYSETNMKASQYGLVCPNPVCKKIIDVDDLRRISTIRSKAERKMIATKGLTPSSKSKALIDKIRSILNPAELPVKGEVKTKTERSTSNDKILVISQWTSFLDLLHVPLRMVKLSNGNCVKDMYDTLDGRMSIKAREETIRKFNDSKMLRILLVSMKACGVGLNLNAANHVFLVDPWWNPAVEEQAIDRVYRLGQKKTVYVYRLKIRKSVEDRIETIKKKKEQMANVALGQGVGNSSKLTTEDFKELFK